ncbi:MAG: response regulator [Deltaproteobacteria bacterium]|nr:response regulator [Candidatus Anaeroferrophillacea bacterium]
MSKAKEIYNTGRLAGGIAHDFNNILCAINGYAELCLVKMPPDNPLREEIGIILHSGDRATRLVRQLLAFSREQAGKMEQLNINDVIDDIRPMLGRLLQEDIEIALSREPQLWPITADRSQLEQVILNLAVNARDAMPRGGRLAIETANLSVIGEHLQLAPGDYVILSFADNGEGIRAEVMDHIFEPFFTTKEKGQGSGLGLATVYGIVKQHNGEITVDSRPGQGSIFRTYLPRADQPVKQEPVKGVVPVQGFRKGTETILLVEDDDMVRQLCIEMLARLGYAVLEAANGEEAMHRCRDDHHRIDLLLTDVVMPKMSGAELVAAVRNRHPQVQVLFMSGYAEQTISAQGLKASETDMIRKPLTLEKLSEAIRRKLD